MFSQTDTARPDTLAQLQERYRLQQQLLDEKDVELAQQRVLLDEREQEIAVLSEKLSLLLAKRYHHSSEKLDALQGSLFDEAELQSEFDKLIEELAAQGVLIDHETGRPVSSQSPPRPNTSAG